MIMLETKRLILRRLTGNDLDDLYQIISDPETMQYYPRPYTKDETMNIIQRNIQSYDEHSYGLWAVCLKPDNTFIGECGITNQNIDGTTVPEIGYHINKHYWNKGYGTEAALACLDYGFNTLGLPEIYIHTYIKNTPSIKIAEKLGMAQIKEYDKKMIATNTVMRHIVYSLKKPG